MALMYLATLMLCVGLISAEGNPMEGMTPAAMCPQIGGLTCKLTQSGCIDIPDVMDCAQMIQMCTATADSLCTCLSACEERCTGKVDCTGLEGKEGEDCHNLYEACISTCQMDCPVIEMNKYAQYSIRNPSEKPSFTDMIIKQLEAVRGTK